MILITFRDMALRSLSQRTALEKNDEVQTTARERLFGKSVNQFRFKNKMEMIDYGRN